MIRPDQAYWARLRKDARSALAVGCALIAVLMALLAILGLLFVGPQSQTRANPLYWLCILPLGWWASGLIAYEPDPCECYDRRGRSRSWRRLPVWEWRLRSDGRVALWIVGTAITVVAAGATEFFYRGSLLGREGPAR